MPLNTETTVGGAGGEFKRPKVQRPLAKPGMYQLQILDVDTVNEKKYQSEELQEKIRFICAIINPGPTYGLYMFYSATPVLSKGGAGKRESNLHLFVKQVYASEGRDLGDDLTDDEIKAFRTDATLLNGLIGRQFLATVKIKKGQGVNDDGTPVQYNIFGDIMPVTEDSYLPEYVAPERVLDPEAANDDPTLTCEAEVIGTDGDTHVCGEVVHGWRKSNNEWYPQKDWANNVVNRYGKLLCGRHISQLRKEAAAAATAKAA